MQPIAHCLAGFLGVLVIAQASAQAQQNAPAVSGNESIPPVGEVVFDFPKRKAGLWELKGASAQAAGLPPAMLCIGDQTDSKPAHLDRLFGRKGACLNEPFKRVGNGWFAESVCKEGKVVVTSRALASGDFNAEYRIDTQVLYQPALNGVKKEDKDAVVGVFQGPCKPGQRPGDLTMAGMGKLNMIDGKVQQIAEPRRKNR
jgi:hypothetical protein